MPKCLCGNEKQNGAWLCDKCIDEEEKMILRDFKKNIMRYFKDVDNNHLICLWKSKNDYEINNRFDLHSVEITQEEFNMLEKQIDKENCYEIE